MSKKRLPWFPCYPDDWLTDTRHMNDAQARVYWDFLCLLYLHEEDGALHATNKWISHELHVHINKWLSVRKFLIADGKLVENPDGSLTNNKAAKVCLERKARSEAFVEAATEREAQRQEYRERNPTFQFVAEARRKKLRIVEPTLQPQASPTPSPTPSLGGGCQEISHTDQRASDQRPALHSHLHIQNKERKIEALKAAKPIPAELVAALIIKVGQTVANAYIDEYYRNGLAAGADCIEAAFPGWLKSKKHVDLNLGWGKRKGRGTFDIGALAKDELQRLAGHGKLPDSAQLAARNKRVAS